MSLADLIRGKQERESVGVATVTLATAATERLEGRSTVASVAAVTVANPPERKTAAGWLLHFPDLDPVAVAFAPERDQAEVLAAYPDALALFDACAKAGLYGDDDRAALPAMFALDPEGTRGLIEAMHDRIASCRRCRHFRRPGLSDGYCTGRDDLPHAYGLLHKLPDDEGMRCEAFERA